MAYNNTDLLLFIAVFHLLDLFMFKPMRASTIFFMHYNLFLVKIILIWQLRKAVANLLVFCCSDMCSALSLGSFLFFPQCLKEAILPNGLKLGRTGTLTADLTGFQSWKSSKTRVIKIIQDQCVSEFHHFLKTQKYAPTKSSCFWFVVGSDAQFSPQSQLLEHSSGEQQTAMDLPIAARLQENSCGYGVSACWTGVYSYRNQSWWSNSNKVVW